jgi:hypothetical protein
MRQVASQAQPTYGRADPWPEFDEPPADNCRSKHDGERHSGIVVSLAVFGTVLTAGAAEERRSRAHHGQRGGAERCQVNGRVRATRTLVGRP